MPRPIPGVSYDIEVKPGRIEIWTYCPTRDGDEYPWMTPFDDHVAYFRQLSEGAKILGVVYNPHPPTTPEWKSRPAAGSTKWTRQVGEWVEVDEKETGDA